MKISATEEGK